jgi:aspartyl-tRNA(Asn)/glutamyl-tRNA(Gln) amidotransferase subunit C
MAKDTKKVTKEDVTHIAKLSKLNFTDKELEKFTKEFNSIVKYIASIEDCDVSGIENVHNLDDFAGEGFDDDKVKESMPTEDLLKNASGRGYNRFVRTCS